MQWCRQLRDIRKAVNDDLKAAQKLRGFQRNHLSVSSGTSQVATAVPDVERQDRLSASTHDNLSVSDYYKEKEDNQDNIAARIPGVSIEENHGEKVFVVRFYGEKDPCDAHSWSLAYKWVSTAVIGSAGALVGWASSIDSGSLTQGMGEFGVSDVAQSLVTALFLIAFGAGALFAAPLSETAGRNVTYILTLSLFSIFTLGAALVPNYGGLLAFRFISGFFAATPLVTFGGSTSDMWSPVQRTYVFPVCACLSFLGPFLAPMVGSWIGQSPLISWRWVYWVTLIFSGLVLSSITLFMPETYGPALLSWKAKQLRQLTGDQRYRSEHELNSATFQSRMWISVTRPFRLFISEPMVVLFSLYLVVVYIVLFGFLTGYTFIFGDVYEFSQGSVGLTYTAINVGFLIAFLLIVPLHRMYVRDLRMAQSRGKTGAPPEARLWFAIIGAPWLPLSLFWMAWTASPSISYWSCLAATVVFGFSAMGIFISTYLYLIDSYHLYAASALVGATLLRYLAAGVMVPVTIPMYKNLGVHWALTLMAFISLLVTPIPFIFYKYGARIRAKSSFIS